MMIHSIHYFNTFIKVAENSPSLVAEMLPLKGDVPTVANLQFNTVSHNPYAFTSDEVLFAVSAKRKKLDKRRLDKEQELIFSKRQPYFRAFPLPKGYGWGVHSNEEGEISPYALNEDAYHRFLLDESLQKVKAIRSDRKTNSK